MSDPVELDSPALSTYVVLAGVVELSVRGETPAHAVEIRRACNRAMEAVDVDVLGTVTEAEVSRTLNELDAADLVDGRRDDTSATGKGRPAYRLTADAEAVRTQLAEDERVAPLADRIGSLDE
ncbi:hypothetical protein ACFQMA_20165 [Halosimplex aquaticum]|uniref:Transcriptional regulator PadR-like family protein n=1 Tax=Halosimplex aquaticum TaxID=3026162 RepID=A0ABD5Y488_9EURY|nr:hypothetical protein [Halosimplex aquaticum]